MTKISVNPGIEDKMLHLSGDAGAIAARKAERQTGDGPRQEVKNTRFCPSSEKFHTVVLKGGRNIYDALENLPVKFLVKISSLSIFHLLRFARRRGGRCRCWQRPRARRRGPLEETTGRTPFCETLGYVCWIHFARDPDVHWGCFLGYNKKATADSREGEYRIFA